MPKLTIISETHNQITKHKPILYVKKNKFVWTLLSFIHHINHPPIKKYTPNSKSTYLFSLETACQPQKHLETLAIIGAVFAQLELHTQIIAWLPMDTFISQTLICHISINSA